MGRCMGCHQNRCICDREDAIAGVTNVVTGPDGETARVTTPPEPVKARNHAETVRMIAHESTKSQDAQDERDARTLYAIVLSEISETARHAQYNMKRRFTGTTRGVLPKIVDLLRAEGFTVERTLDTDGSDLLTISW